MGSITYYVNGMPVTVSDRTYSLDENANPANPAAYKTWGDSGSSVEKLWREQPSLRMVTTFLARNLAQVPMHAFERAANDDRVRLDRKHPLSRVLRAPDAPRLTWFRLMYSLVIDMCLTDRYAAQVFILPDGSAQIVRLPPSSWKFVRDTTKRPKYIEVARTDGTNFRVPLDRAVWLDGYPSDEDTSPIASLRGILAEADMAADYRRELWANGGRMPGWIERPASQKWSGDARKTFRDGWQKYASGGVRAGMTPVLEDDMKYHELGIGITPENGQQIESRKLSIAEVANAYQVPPQMVGQDAGSSYNSVAGYRAMLYEDTLGSWFRDLGEAFNMRLIPQFADLDPDTVYVEFNVSEKLRLAFEDQARIFQTTTGAPIMTRSEARSRLNLPHLDEADALIVPMNVSVGGQASATDSGKQNIGGSNG